MDLGFAGEKVVAQDVGHTVGLRFSGGFEVRIESGFRLTVDGGSHELVPGDDVDPSLVAALNDREVTAARSDDSGGLCLDFGAGTSVRVAADPDYEAWTMAGPRGFKVVSEAGGGLAVWSPQV